MHAILEFVGQLMNTETQQAFIRTGGYALLAAIVFAETGLLVGFFLPGDSLLFSAGVVAAVFPDAGLDVTTMCVLLSATAIVGDATGYAFGRWTGPKLFERKDSFLFRRSHLLATQAFYERHGGKTIVIARFMPFARTFAPIVAGIASMPYRKFAAWNVAGGILWVTSMTLLGYFLGSQISPKNAERAVLLIIVFSVMPMVIGWLRSKLKPAAPTPADGSKAP
jgi:membrane-associated protein